MKKILLSANPRDAVWLGWGAAKLNALKSFTKTAFTRYLTPEAGVLVCIKHDPANPNGDYVSVRSSRKLREVKRVEATVASEFGRRGQSNDGRFAAFPVVIAGGLGSILVFADSAEISGTFQLWTPSSRTGGHWVTGGIAAFDDGTVLMTEWWYDYTAGRQSGDVQAVRYELEADPDNPGKKRYGAGIIQVLATAPVAPPAWWAKAGWYFTSQGSADARVVTTTPALGEAVVYERQADKTFAQVLHTTATDAADGFAPPVTGMEVIYNVSASASTRGGAVVLSYFRQAGIVDGEVIPFNANYGYVAGVRVLLRDTISAPLQEKFFVKARGETLGLNSYSVTGWWGGTGFPETPFAVNDTQRVFDSATGTWHSDYLGTYVVYFTGGVARFQYFPAAFGNAINTVVTVAARRTNNTYYHKSYVNTTDGLVLVDEGENYYGGTANTYGPSLSSRPTARVIETDIYVSQTSYRHTLRVANRYSQLDEVRPNGQPERIMSPNTGYAEVASPNGEAVVRVSYQLTATANPNILHATGVLEAYSRETGGWNGVTIQLAETAWYDRDTAAERFGVDFDPEGRFALCVHSVFTPAGAEGQYIIALYWVLLARTSGGFVEVGRGPRYDDGYVHPTIAYASDDGAVLHGLWKIRGKTFVVCGYRRATADERSGAVALGPYELLEGEWVRYGVGEPEEISLTSIGRAYVIGEIYPSLYSYPPDISLYGAYLSTYTPPYYFVADTEIPQYFVYATDSGARFLKNGVLTDVDPSAKAALTKINYASRAEYLPFVGYILYARKQTADGGETYLTILKEG